MTNQTLISNAFSQLGATAWRCVVRPFAVIVSLGVLVSLVSACASSSPDVISREDAQTLSQVSEAVVLNVRPVVIDGKQSGVGAAVGGVVGALGGSSGRSNQTESQIVGVLAGVAGAVAGNAIERLSTKEEATEILVQLKGGERRAIVQAKGGETLVVGDAVLIITSSGKVRIVKAPK